MRQARAMRQAGGLLFGLLFGPVAGMIAGCGAPDGLSADSQGDGIVLNWDGRSARVCVTDLNATCPKDKDGHVEGGLAYWVIDATCFPSGIDSPVTYGHLPGCAKDVTPDNGGPAGGRPLEKGKTYKLSVAGFGGDPAEKTFTVP